MYRSARTFVVSPTPIMWRVRSLRGTASSLVVDGGGLRGRPPVDGGRRRTGLVPTGDTVPAPPLSACCEGCRPQRQILTHCLSSFPDNPDRSGGKSTLPDLFMGTVLKGPVPTFLSSVQKLEATNTELSQHQMSTLPSLGKKTCSENAIRSLKPPTDALSPDSRVRSVRERRGLAHN